MNQGAVLARAAVVLRFYEDMSFDEVAGVSMRALNEIESKPRPRGLNSRRTDTHRNTP